MKSTTNPTIRQGLASLANLRLGWRGIPGTNSLTNEEKYFFNISPQWDNCLYCRFNAKRFKKLGINTAMLKDNIKIRFLTKNLRTLLVNFIKKHQNISSKATCFLN